MQLGKVVGHAVSTVKHASLNGWRLLLIQPLAAEGVKPDGEPLLVIDNLGAWRGATVLLSNDGQGARDLVDSKTSPARWFVMGICDG
jgi:ethanolamine utilization protein EutN